jgi:tRNA (guanine-N7-)-methyltransferase
MSNSVAKTTDARFYGRRKGRPLHKRKSHLIETALSDVTIAVPVMGSIDPQSFFTSKPEKIWLEIGFGGGEHLAAQAERNPTVGFLGCEPFLNGIASLLDHTDRRQLKNIRVFPDDARILLKALPEQSIHRCFVLFADPWPKARHAERRFIGPSTIPLLARVLAEGAELRLATDDAQLAMWMRDHMLASSTLFAPLFDSTTPPYDWVQTRYEAKGIKAGRQPVYMGFERL